MSTPLFSDTLGDLVVALAQSVDDEIFEGTASGGTTTTFLDNDLKLFDDDSLLKGAYTLKYAGTGAGEVVGVTTYTASGATLTFKPVATAPDDTTKYLLTRKYHPRDYTRALQRAQQLLARTNLVEQVDRSIILGSSLKNGTFYLWSSGTSSAPDNWTLGGTSAAVAQEATVVKGTLYSAKLTNNATNALTFDQSLPAIGNYKGVSLRARAWIYSTTASRVTLELTDGVSTETKTHGGTGWEDLHTDALAIGANASAIRVRVQISSGGAISTYACVVQLQTYPYNGHEYDIDADNTFVFLEEDAWVGQADVSGDPAAVNFYDNHLDGQAWEVLPEGTRRVKMNIDGDLNGHILSLRGWKHHAELTGVTITWTGNPEAILMVAAPVLKSFRGDASQRDIILALQEANRLFGTKITGVVRTVEQN